MKPMMYHYVRPQAAGLPFFPYLALSDFERQLDHFEEAYGFVSTEAFTAWVDGAPAPAGVLHTFDGCNSRAISRIDRPRTRYSRRTRAIVSTPFIPQPTRPNTRTGSVPATRDRGQFWTPIPPLRGSTFHADPQVDVVSVRTFACVPGRSALQTL